MIISDPKKPKIEAKVKTENGVKSSGIRGATGPVVTVRIPKPSANVSSTDDKTLTAASRIASGLASQSARSNSPMTDSKGKEKRVKECVGTNPIYSNGTKHGGIVRVQSPTQGSAEAAIEQNIKRDHPGPTATLDRCQLLPIGNEQRVPGLTRT